MTSEVKRHEVILKSHKQTRPEQQPHPTTAAKSPRMLHKHPTGRLLAPRRGDPYQIARMKKNEVPKAKTTEKQPREIYPDQFDQACKILTGALPANTRREMTIVLVRGIVQLKYSQLRNTLRQVGLDDKEIRQADISDPSLPQLLTYGDKANATEC